MAYLLCATFWAQSSCKLFHSEIGITTSSKYSGLPIEHMPPAQRDAITMQCSALLAFYLPTIILILFLSFLWFKEIMEMQVGVKGSFVPKLFA